MSNNTKPHRLWFTGLVSGRAKPRRSGEYGTHWTYSNASDEVRDGVVALLESVGVSPSEAGPTTLRVSHRASLRTIRDRLLVIEFLPAEDRAAWEAV